MPSFFGIFGSSMAGFKSGKAISAQKLNSYAEAISRGRTIVGPGSGLGLMQMPSGVSIRSTTRLIVVPAFLTTAASAASASGSAINYTSDGRCSFAVDGGTSLTASTTVTGIVIYNIHDKKYASGALVWLGFWNNKWWIVDVWSCLALS